MRIALTALLTVAVVFGGAYGLGAALAQDEVYVEEVPGWEVVEVAGDGRSFMIQYTAGNPACHSEVVGSRETHASVVVTVLVRAHVEGAGSRDNCEDFSVGRRREIGLDEPVGTRWVVDATTGRRIGVLVCSPASTAPGCRAGAELGTAYPLRLEQRCGAVARLLRRPLVAAGAAPRPSVEQRRRRSRLQRLDLGDRSRGDLASDRCAATDDRGR